MRMLIAAIMAACVAGLAHAHPLVIEETSIVAPGYSEGYDVWTQIAIDGDYAVAQLVSYVEDDEDNGYDLYPAAHLFQLSGGTWSDLGILWADGVDGEGQAVNGFPVAMKNGVMALGMDPLRIYELEGGQWVQKTVIVPGQPSARHGAAYEMEIDGGRIFLGSGSWGGSIFEKDTSGSWVLRHSLDGDNSGDGIFSVGGPVSLAPNWAAVLSEYNGDGLPAPAVQVFQRTSMGWPLNVRLVAPAGHSLGDVAIRDNEMFIGDFARFGAGVWRRNSGGQWAVADRLRTASDFDNRDGNDGRSAGKLIRKGDGFVLQQGYNAERRTSVINVFQPDSGGAHRHVAILAARNGDPLENEFAVSGRRVVAIGRRAVYHFELPTSFDQPSLFQDTFSNGNGAGWSYVPGSQFAVVQSGVSRVFRQSSTAGDAGAVLDAHDWTNQSIQADITPTAVNGADRWVGLATRRTDAANYYYATLRSSGVLQLKRMHNGSFTTLGSWSVPWALNRTYRIRLESVGSLHRVYVDGAQVIEAWDRALSHGRAALLSYRVAADYDNVVVSPFATQAIYTANKEYPPQLNPAPWEYSGNGSWEWVFQDYDVFSRQSSTAGDARAAVGSVQIVNTDQAVEARVLPRAFSTTGDPWFGLMARYADASNYLYVAVRKSNTLMLRKLVNGNIVSLGSVPFTVALNTPYSLRLEAVGSAVRAYVDGRLVLEATDPQPANGRVGLVGYRAAVDYEEFRAVIP